jgi:hypothetical protein
MILDTLDEIPFTMVWKRLLDEEATFALMIFTPVPVTPFTVVVRVLVLEVLDRLLIVLKAVEEATPFTLVVSVTPLVVVATDTPLLEITEEVAVIPFTLTVRVLPETEAERELIMLATKVETPFTID